MKKLIAAFVLILLNYLNVKVTASLQANHILNHLGTRTPYRFVGNTNDSQVKYPDCKDSKIWMIVRHGTRRPNLALWTAQDNLRKVRDDILSEHSKQTGPLTEEQLLEFEKWDSHFTAAEEKFLTLEGQEEMILIAERMQKRFPNAIKQKYSNKTFLFRYTATQRTHQSAQYFANGLFEKKEAQKVIFDAVKTVDKVLRFYKHCDRWQKQVKKNPNTYKEQRLYGISSEMNKTLASVSKRLGLNRELKLDVVNAMYKLCAFETAWYKHHLSPWCHAFDKDNIKPLEYYQDLKAYWLSGYGYKLTYQQACVSVKDMFDSLSRDGGPRASFFFTHSGTMLKILAHLGLYKDESHLMGDALVEDRKWRTSKIDSFATNIAFVLFKCKGGDRILTIHQENIVRLPMCSEDLCPVKTLRHHFQDSIENCNFEEMCSLDSAVNEVNEF